MLSWSAVREQSLIQSSLLGWTQEEKTASLLHIKQWLVNLSVSLENILKISIGEKISIPQKYYTSTMTCVFVCIYV